MMAPADPQNQMNTYRSYVTVLADPGSKDELKLKAAQELSENFEVNNIKISKNSQLNKAYQLFTIYFTINESLQNYKKKYFSGHHVFVTVSCVSGPHDEDFLENPTRRGTALHFGVHYTTS